MMLDGGSRPRGFLRTSPQRLLVGLIFSALVIFLVSYHSTTVQQTWRGLPQAVGLGDKFRFTLNSGSWSRFSYGGMKNSDDLRIIGENPAKNAPRPVFAAGDPGPADTQFNKTLVIPRITAEDVKWLDEEVPNIHKKVYIADSPADELEIPKNKGHEVMIYLTYIIDHYDDLPDVSIFMHAHRWTWHNNDILGQDAAQMIQRLNSRRVIREGYMNLRCHWPPGCPTWMHPGTSKDDKDGNRPEETEIARFWSELFPKDSIPQVLAAPCCSQFALSRERIHALPKETYMYYRQWLLNTPLEDSISGRVWEYTWQFIFTGKSELCPLESECYCDGYGACYGGEDEIHEHLGLRNELGDRRRDLEDWNKENDRAQEQLKKIGGKEKLTEGSKINFPKKGRDKELRKEIKRLEDRINRETREALDRGEDPKNRAKEAGREWNEGDGF